MRKDELLLEAQNYEGMFNQLLQFIEEWEHGERIKKAFADDIKWARTVLKRRDRVTWWLRLRRVYYAAFIFQHVFGPDNAGEDDAWKPGHEPLQALMLRYSAEANLPASQMFKFTFQTSDGGWFMPDSLASAFGGLTRKLEHFMGVPAETIQNLRFDRQTPDTILAEFTKLEAEWQQRGAQEIDPEGEIVIDFHDGWAWYKLDRASCSKEADAMGHCGNQFGTETDRLLSLRRTLKNGKHRPSLTFILDQEGYLGEMKGRANEKPNAKYHPYIITLLKSPGINGLKGGGYEPENNFDITDLTPEQREDVYSVKPAMMTCSDYLKKFGVDDTLKNKMEKTFEGLEPNLDNHPPGLQQRGDSFVYAMDSYADWVGALRTLGDESINNVLDADTSQYIGLDGDDEWFANFIEGLPHGINEKVWAYIEEEAGDILRKKFGDNYLDEEGEDGILKWIQANNVRPLYDLENAARDAVVHGYEEGTQKSILKSLKSEAKTGFGRNVHLDTEPHEDGRYYLWTSVEYWCQMLDDPESPLHDEQNLDLYAATRSIWDETPSISDDIMHYYEQDGEEELKYFIENCPEECRVEVPKLTPISEMTPEEIHAEMNALGWDDAYIEKYYGGSFAKMLPSGLARLRQKYYGVSENLTEAHHQLDDRDSTGLAPIKRGDTARVFHGFRDSIDAIRTAKVGLSGASRTGRVYSYEADNNPKGLFVTLSLDVAKRFVGAFGTRTIMEFVARVEDLEAPVWPNGSYTVQGEYAAYFGHGHKGRRARNDARRAQARDLAGAGHDDRITTSDDPVLASTLMHNPELQALFIGHLSPQDIAAFWVEGVRDHWTRYTVEQYLAEFGEGYPETDVMRDVRNKVFTAGEDFDGDKWLAGMLEMGGKDVEKTLQNLWNDVLKAPQKNRARTFLGYFETFLYPKQVIPAMQWMRDHYGRR